MTAITALINSATKLLDQAGVPSPQVDAELLLAHVLGIERSNLLKVTSINAEQHSDFEALVARRANRVPLQHLTGVAHFRHISLAVGPGVFVPRPETELLVEAAISYLKTLSGPKLAVDLCAGSGAIALCLALDPTRPTHNFDVLNNHPRCSLTETGWSRVCGRSRRPTRIARSMLA